MPRRSRAQAHGLRMFTIMSVCLLTCLSGCAFNRGNIGDPIRSEAIEKIQKGITTRAEVVTLLGAPDRMVHANDRDVLHYYHYDLKSGSLLLILVNFSRINVKSDDLFVLVNRDGVVEDVLTGRRTDNLEFQFWPFDD